MTHPSRTPFIAPALPLWQQALLASRESLPGIAMEKERAGANITETLGAPGFTLQAQHQSQAALPPGQKIGSGTLGVHPAGTGWVNIGLASTLRPVCRAPSTQELRCYIDLINYSSPKAQKLQRLFLFTAFCSPMSSRAGSWNLYPAFERGRPQGQPGPSARRGFSCTGMRPGRPGGGQPVTLQCSHSQQLWDKAGSPVSSQPAGVGTHSFLLQPSHPPDAPRHRPSAL